MHLENLTEEQLAQLEREVSSARIAQATKGGNDSSIRGNYESAIFEGSISGLESMQAQQKTDYAISGGNDSAIRNTLEGYSAEELSSLEREIATAREKYAVSGGNDSSIRGNYESLNVNELRAQESMVAQMRRENALSGGNDSSIRGNTESAIIEGNIDHLEAQVKQQKIDDAWAIAYFSGLNQNPRIENEQEFKSAVRRSIQSNRIINKFFDEFTDTLGTKLFVLKNLTPNQTEAIEESKRLIEEYLNIYGRFMFELKTQDASINYVALQMPDFIKETLWQQQKRLDVTFAMPIPAKYNGKDPFSLMGDAVSVINTMNGYTPGGYKGRILGDNPEFQQDVEMGE